MKLAELKVELPPSWTRYTGTAPWFDETTLICWGAMPKNEFRRSFCCPLWNNFLQYFKQLLAGYSTYLNVLQRGGGEAGNSYF